MTLGTIQRGVLSGEWKIGLSMVELGQGVAAIVAGQAVNPKLGCVFEHEGGISFRMAAAAVVEVGAESPLGGMACCTVHRCGGIIHLVPDQAETCA